MILGDKIRVLVTACILLGCIALQACKKPSSSTDPLVTISGSTMGTYYRVTVASLPASVNEGDLKMVIADRLEKINSLMSTYVEDSEVSRFNQSAETEWFPVSKETATVVIEALHVYELSEGAFDITVGPLVDLWGFGSQKKERKIPSHSSIESALEKTGSKHLRARLSPPALKKEIREIQIDLSAIAKGYAVDSVAESLVELGMNDYLVDIGGEMLAGGQKADSTPWKIAIESPTADKREIEKVMGLENQSIATSGDYRNYFEVEGQRYSHEIDPRTGQPIGHRLVSVSVLTSSCMRADALATALIVMGEEKGESLAESENLAVYFILKKDEGFGVWKSTGFNQ